MSKIGQRVILKRHLLLYSHFNINLGTELSSIYLNFGIYMWAGCPSSHYSQQSLHENSQQSVI